MPVANSPVTMPLPPRPAGHRLASSRFAVDAEVAGGGDRRTAHCSSVRTSSVQPTPPPNVSPPTRGGDDPGAWANDRGVVQMASVAPRHSYRLSCWIQRDARIAERSITAAPQRAAGHVVRRHVPRHHPGVHRAAKDSPTSHAPWHGEAVRGHRPFQMARTVVRSPAHMLLNVEGTPASGRGHRLHLQQHQALRLPQGARESGLEPRSQDGDYLVSCSRTKRVVARPSCGSCR